MHGSRLDAVLARIYYVVGVLYYLSHWVALIGVAGVAGGVTLLARYAFSGEVVVASGFVLIWGINLKIKSYRVQLYSDNPNFWHILEECVYDVSAAPVYRYTKRLRLKALSGGVDSWSHGFGWSGHGRMHVVCSQQPENVPVTEVSIVQEEYGPRNVCRVRFERPLKRGEIVEFAVEMTLVDEEGAARPFLSQKINTPAGELIMRVRLPQGATEYVQAVYESPTTRMPSLEKKVNLAVRSEEARWVIKKPRIRRHYQIRWAA